jgi:hypothetical protein
MNIFYLYYKIKYISYLIKYSQQFIKFVSSILDDINHFHLWQCIFLIQHWEKLIYAFSYWCCYVSIVYSSACFFCFPLRHGKDNLLFSSDRSFSVESSYVNSCSMWEEGNLGNLEKNGWGCMKLKQCHIFAFSIFLIVVI